MFHFDFLKNIQETTGIKYNPLGMFIPKEFVVGALENLTISPKIGFGRGEKLFNSLHKPTLGGTLF